MRRRRRELGLSTVEFGKRAALLAGRNKPLSASAIRNQENGTNGVPYAMISPYSEILQVQPGWLMFGVSDEEQPGHIDEGEIIAPPEMEVRVADTITAGWTEGSAPPAPTSIWLDIPVWDGAPLIAYEAVGDSLAPIYPRGTYLIIAPAHITKIRDGDHVVITRIESVAGEEVPLKSLREVRVTARDGKSATLLGLGAQQQAPIHWFTRGAADYNSHIYAEGVVIAVYRVIPPERRGRLAALPDYLELSADQWSEFFSLDEEDVPAPVTDSQDSD